MSWLGESIRDENGQADIAYVSLFVVTGSVLGTILLVSAVTVWAFARCIEKFDVSPQVLCRFDPQPMGIAVGAICVGFATALGALAGYMAATRRQYPPVAPGKQDIAQQIVLSSPPQATPESERGTPSKPLNVVVKRGAKAKR